jgi:hypothetical protein
MSRRTFPGAIRMAHGRQPNHYNARLEMDALGLAMCPPSPIKNAPRLQAPPRIQAAGRAACIPGKGSQRLLRGRVIEDCTHGRVG